MVAIYRATDLHCSVLNIYIKLYIYKMCAHTHTLARVHITHAHIHAQTHIDAKFSQHTYTNAQSYIFTKHT